LGDAMVLILLGIIGFSLIALVVVWHLSRRNVAAEEHYPGIPVLLLGVWIVASAVWGPYFFALKLPGLFDISIDRLFFLVLLAVLGGCAVTGGIRLRGNCSIELFMILFSLVCLGSMIQHGFKETMPEFPSPWNVFLNGYFVPFLVFVYAKNLVLTEKDVTFIFHALFYLGVYLCVTAFFEFFDLRAFVFPQYINDPKIWLHLDRARGPFLNAAFNGLALNIGFICGFFLFSRKAGLSRVIHGFLLMLYFPAVFFTQTRSVYLGFVVTLGSLLALYKTPAQKWKRFALPIAVALVGLMIASPKILSSERRGGGILQTQEVEVRMSLIKRSLLMIGDQPFFGVGLAQFIPESIKRFRGRVSTVGSYTEQTQHNHIIGMTVELGLAGISIYIMIILSIFRRLFRLSERLEETGYISINFLISISIIMSVYLITNLFVEPAYFVFVNAVFFLMAGITDSIYNKYELSPV
jgi:O-antigen ligase